MSLHWKSKSGEQTQENLSLLSCKTNMGQASPSILIEALSTSVFLNFILKGSRCTLYLIGFLAFFGCEWRRPQLPWQVLPDAFSTSFRTRTLHKTSRYVSWNLFWKPHWPLSSYRPGERHHEFHALLRLYFCSFTNSEWFGCSLQLHSFPEVVWQSVSGDKCWFRIVYRYRVEIIDMDHWFRFGIGWILSWFSFNINTNKSQWDTF